MKPFIKRLVLVVLAAVLLSACTLPFVGGKNQGALQVTSNLAAAVFLDENHIGQTPFFDENIKVGEYNLKLVASGEGGDNSWQSKISISKRVLAVVNYQFGSDSEAESYEILELEPLSSKKATELTISTLPDNAIVKFDGELKGFSPISFKDISEGDHTISLEAPGYKEKTINAKVNAGHHLKITAQLARDLTIKEDLEASGSGEVKDDKEEKEEDEDTKPSPTPKSSPSPSPSPTTTTTSGVISGETDPDDIKAPYVKILEASAGITWLRVHSDPAGGSENEVAKVKVGTYFSYVENNGSGWSKIEYQASDEGWVSSRYAELTK